MPGTPSASSAAPVAQLQAPCLSVHAPRLLCLKKINGDRDTVWWLLLSLLPVELFEISKNHYKPRVAARVLNIHS
eukprot:bmy_07957T0